MTTAQIFACVVAVVPVIVAIVMLVAFRRRSRRESVEWETDGNVITFDRALTEEEVEAFKVRWLELYGKPGNAHHVEELHLVAPVACSAYRPPSDPADSGLCAGCGMFDYKHRESS